MAYLVGFREGCCKNKIQEKKGDKDMGKHRHQPPWLVGTDTPMRLLFTSRYILPLLISGSECLICLIFLAQCLQAAQYSALVTRQAAAATDISVQAEFSWSCLLMVSLM